MLKLLSIVSTALAGLHSSFPGLAKHVNLAQLVKSAAAAALSGQGVPGALEAIAADAALIVAPQYAAIFEAALQLAGQAYAAYQAAHAAGASQCPISVSVSAQPSA